MGKLTDGINETIAGIGTTGLGVSSTVAGAGILAAAFAPEVTIPVALAGIAVGGAATIGGAICLGTGISDTYEGINTIYNGFEGINTSAYNPVRDTLFVGNESSYRATQMLGLGLASARSGNSTICKSVS